MASGFGQVWAGVPEVQNWHAGGCGTEIGGKRHWCLHIQDPIFLQEYLQRASDCPSPIPSVLLPKNMSARCRDTKGDRVRTG